MLKNSFRLSRTTYKATVNSTLYAIKHFTTSYGTDGTLFAREPSLEYNYSIKQQYMYRLLILRYLF